MLKKDAEKLICPVMSMALIEDEGNTEGLFVVFCRTIFCMAWKDTTVDEDKEPNGSCLKIGYKQSL